MKIAFLKIGSRIKYDPLGVINSEVLILIDFFVKAGIDLHYFTQVLKNDTEIEGAHMRDFSDWNNDEKFDAMVVVNGPLNFYGGAESKAITENYKLINNFNGKVYFLITDLTLKFTQIWEGVLSKQEKFDWKTRYTREDLEITRDDITFISQAYNLENAKKILGEVRGGIPHKNMIHYPLMHSVMAYFNRLENTEDSWKNRQYDISYGGSYRGARHKKIVKYYFGHDDDIKVELFGKVGEPSKYENVKLRFPDHNPGVSGMDFIMKMNNSYSTIAIADKNYEGNILTQRLYESIYANVITFVDEEFDPEHRLYANDKELDFLYVNSREEVAEKLRLIKANNLMQYICDKQYEAVKIDKNNYINGLIDIIKNNYKTI